ncbi:MAG: SAM-dependent methyltransferase, partial [Microthrixaceae bacterium]|nr:SAM-dependent methyltransferase [Microthrixaceae bacterium]
PECLAALDYVCVERSERLRADARDLLGESARVCGSLEEVEAPFVGVLMANELLDNLAFRLIVRDGGGWAEVFVVDGA